jgi:hypothetical protein
MQLSPPIPVEQLTRGTDRIRCVPYHMTLTAQGCVERQDAAQLQGTQDHRKPLGDKLRGDYRKCIDCPIGQAVRAQLSGTPP